MATKKKKTLNQWLIPQLRKISRYWPEKHVCINNAKEQVQIGYYKNGKPEYKTLIRCNMCKELYDRTEIDVDHIVPVANIDGFKDWESYIKALFCPAEGLQAICKSCHYIKTQAESEDRRKKKRKKSEEIY